LKCESDRGENHSTITYFRQAADFAQRAHEEDKPFFAFIAPFATHWPSLVPSSYRDAFKEVGLPGFDVRSSPEPGTFAGDPTNTYAYAEYYAAIALVDDGVGVLHDRLSALGIDANTLWIFTSDNGLDASVPGFIPPNIIFNGCSEDEAPGGEAFVRASPVPAEFGTGALGLTFDGGLSGLKGQTYEGGHKVFSLWRWPEGKIGGGRDLGALTHGVDVLPTLIELCNLRRIKGGYPMDGESFAGGLVRRLPAAQDQREAFEEPPLYKVRFTSSATTGLVYKLNAVVMADYPDGRKYRLLTTSFGPNFVFPPDFQGPIPPPLLPTGQGRFVELYEITSNPAQRPEHNLIADERFAAVREQLIDEYERWFADVSADENIPDRKVLEWVTVGDEVGGEAVLSPAIADAPNVATVRTPAARARVGTYRTGRGPSCVRVALTPGAWPPATRLRLHPPVPSRPLPSPSSFSPLPPRSALTDDH
jgi:hypothetical protein